MVCSNCGHELKPGKKFCTNCGTKIAVNVPFESIQVQNNDNVQKQDVNNRDFVQVSEQNVVQNQYNDPYAGQNQYSDQNVVQNQYNDPYAGQNQYSDPNVVQNQYNDPYAGQNQYNDQNVVQNQYNDSYAGQNQYNNTNIDQGQYSDLYVSQNHEQYGNSYADQNDQQFSDYPDYNQDNIVDPYINQSISSSEDDNKKIAQKPKKQWKQEYTYTLIAAFVVVIVGVIIVVKKFGGKNDMYVSTTEAEIKAEVEDEYEDYEPYEESETEVTEELIDNVKNEETYEPEVTQNPEELLWEDIDEINNMCNKIDSAIHNERLKVYGFEYRNYAYLEEGVNGTVLRKLYIPEMSNQQPHAVTQYYDDNGQCIYAEYNKDGDRNSLYVKGGTVIRYIHNGEEIPENTTLYENIQKQLSVYGTYYYDLMYDAYYSIPEYRMN